MEKGETSLYLQLLKKVLVDYTRVNSYEYHPLSQVNVNWKNALLFPLDKLLTSCNYVVCKRKYVVEEKRINGYDWPAQATTMIGIHRLNNIENCIRDIVKNHIPGDFIETGVWRGGAAMFMRAVLKELEITDRKIWAADSFKGLPKPNAQVYAHDAGNTLHSHKILSVSLSEVKNNFKKYDLLDDQVIFLEGLFKDTLPTAPIQQLALLRLDGDLYESTIQSLENLYPKLAVGGYVIIDDYHAFTYCKQAVDDYRTKRGITEPICDIDKQAVYWKRNA